MRHFAGSTGSKGVIDQQDAFAVKLTDDLEAIVTLVVVTNVDRALYE